MSIFDAIKEKLNSQREEREKATYEQMSCEKANELFQLSTVRYSNGTVSYTDRKRGVNFSFNMWLKYSFDAPKGLNIQKSINNSELYDYENQCWFVLEACERYGVDKKKNRYLNIDFDGLQFCRISENTYIWQLIDVYAIQPFREDSWLFDRSLYAESICKENYSPSDKDGYEIRSKYNLFSVLDINYRKIVSIILFQQEDFKKKYGIPLDTNPCEIFKQNGKFVDLYDFLKVADKLQTIMFGGEKVSEVIMRYQLSDIYYEVKEGRRFFTNSTVDDD